MDSSEIVEGTIVKLPWSDTQFWSAVIVGDSIATQGKKAYCTVRAVHECMHANNYEKGRTGDRSTGSADNVVSEPVLPQPSIN